MGINPIWTRSRVLIVALGLVTLLYAVFLGLLFLRLPGDGYGVHLSADGFTIDRAIPGGELHKNDTVIRTVDPQSKRVEWDLDDGLLRPGTWYRRVFGQTPLTPATRTYIVSREDSKVQRVEVQLTRTTLGDLVSRTGILFFLGLVFVFNGLFIILRRGDDRAGRLMALALLVEGLNLVNNTINVFSINVSISLHWLFVPIDVLSFWATFGLLLHIFMIFPQESPWIRRHPWALWVVHALNPLVSGIGGLALGGGSTLGVRAAIFQLAYPIAGLQLLGALTLMSRTYRSTNQPLVRSQIRWIIWGISVGVAGWLGLFAAPIVVTGNPLTDLSMAMIPLIAVPITFTFAVTRYRLLEIDTVINRSLVYGVLSTILIAVYFGNVALFSRGLQLLTGREDDSVTVFLSTLAVALIFTLVRDRVQRFIDQTFYPSKLNFQRLLLRIGGELSTTLAFDELIALLTETIPQRLGVEGAVLFVLDKAEENFIPHGKLAQDPLPYTPELAAQLQDGRVLLAGQDEDVAPGLQICLPLLSREHLIGLYGFGPKLSGAPYSGEEIQILRTLGHQITIAVENTRLYHQIEMYSKSLEDLVGQRTHELEQAHEAVASERNKLDAVLNTIADALVVTDTEGDITLTNPVFESIVGSPSGEIIGRSLSDVVADESIKTMVTKALNDSSQIFSADLTLDERVYRASACALCAENLHDRVTNTGDVVSGVVTVLRDVTHEVAVDRMKTDFISVVSHELRTPLTSVLGFAKLIHRAFDRHIVPALQIQAQDETSTGGQRKLERAVGRVYQNLDIIESESLRLTRLINNVLDISKMEAGKIEWREEKVNPAQVIHSAVAGTSALAQEKDLPVIVDLPPSLSRSAREGEIVKSMLESHPYGPTLWGDFDRLVQVVTNLLSNAIKFTAEGQITVTCRAQDGQLAISVTDTGIGIAPEDLDQVFEKFKQVGDTLPHHPKGSGLGLSICKEIVEHHGGMIRVESERGIGSTFIVTLPILHEARLPGPHEPLIEIRRRISERVPVAGDPAPLILVVDDEINIRRLLRQELTDVGYRVIEAADGVQALAQTRRQRPDLIVLDVMMPGVSGFDVTSALKADERTADIPILILSIVEDRQRGLRLGADEYLTKPVDTQYLLHCIADLLQEVKLGAGTPEADLATEVAGPQKKVLVVDDDVSVVETITRALRGRGFEVVEAYDLRGAIQCAETEKPDLVILDAMLSKTNDYELLKALRVQDQERRISIIVLSSEASSGERITSPDQSQKALDDSPLSNDLDSPG